MDPRKNDGRLVYSSDQGRVKPQPVPSGIRRVPPGQAAKAAPPDDGIVRIQRDKKGRGGKTATTVTGLAGSDDELDTLLKALKQHIGAGGSREGRVLILQGDQRERLFARLEALGHKVKLAGG